MTLEPLLCRDLFGPGGRHDTLADSSSEVNPVPVDLGAEPVSVSASRTKALLNHYRPIIWAACMHGGYEKYGQSWRPGSPATAVGDTILGSGEGPHGKFRLEVPAPARRGLVHLCVGEYLLTPCGESMWTRVRRHLSGRP